MGQTLGLRGLGFRVRGFRVQGLGLLSGAMGHEVSPRTYIVQCNRPQESIYTYMYNIYIYIYIYIYIEREREDFTAKVFARWVRESREP